MFQLRYHVTVTKLCDEVSTLSIFLCSWVCTLYWYGMKSLTPWWVRNNLKAHHVLWKMDGYNIKYMQLIINELKHAKQPVGPISQQPNVSRHCTNLIR